MLKRCLSVLWCLALAVSAAQPARILCRGADGHVAIEWASASCCGSSVGTLKPSPLGSALDNAASGGCGDCGDCVDTLLPSTGPVVQASSVAWIAPPFGCAVFQPSDRLCLGFESSFAPHSATGPPLYLAHRSLLI